MRLSGVFTFAAYGLINGNRAVSSIAAVSLRKVTFSFRWPAFTRTRTSHVSSMWLRCSRSFADRRGPVSTWVTLGRGRAPRPGAGVAPRPCAGVADGGPPARGWFAAACTGRLWSDVVSELVLVAV